MIVDSHNHVGGPDRRDRKKQSPEGIVAAMRAADVDRAIIFPFSEVSPGVSFSKANDYIAKAAEAYPEKLIGFARLDPNYKEKALAELERAICKLGLKGIKLHPDAQKFSLGDSFVVKILEKASELDVPVIFDSGGKLSQPKFFEPLAKQVSGAKIIMAHMWGKGYLEIAEKFDNIYLGTAGMFNLKKLREALDRLDAEKIIAGSDSPYFKMYREVQKIDTIPGIKRKEKELILGENIRNLLLR